MTIHTIEDMAEAADAEGRAIAEARAGLQSPPECRPGCICHCNRTMCACWDDTRLAMRDLIALGHTLRAGAMEGHLP